MRTNNQNNIDNGFMQHVGYEQTIQDRPNYNMMWSPERLAIIQQKITQLLEGVSEDGRPIIVTLPVIGNVLSSCYQSNTPSVGSIYSRFIQPDAEPRNDVAMITDRTINIIVSQIKNEYLTIQNNKKLTIWNTVRGDFNPVGLRSHAPIKIQKRRHLSMNTAMNY